MRLQCVESGSLGDEFKVRFEPSVSGSGTRTPHKCEDRCGTVPYSSKVGDCPVRNRRVRASKGVGVVSQSACGCESALSETSSDERTPPVQTGVRPSRPVHRVSSSRCARPSVVELHSTARCCETVFPCTCPLYPSDAADDPTRVPQCVCRSAIKKRTEELKRGS